MFNYVIRLLFSLFFIILINYTKANDSIAQERKINKQKALLFIDSIKSLAQSKYWIHVNPDSFLLNVKKNIVNPLQLVTGVGTNFCSYSAVTYTVLMNEPYRYAQCMIELYNTGQAKYRNIRLHPSKTILKEAGTMLYQGDLDHHFADQIWYLSLAHKFKGYLNVFNNQYHKGDENTLWAACNLAKFNRMLRRLCKFKIKSKGSDLIRPSIPKEKFIPFLQELLLHGEVYLYLNNGVLRKKNHNRIQKRFPTHFVVLKALQFENDLVTLVYWDGDYKTVKQVTRSFLRDIVFGITWVKYKVQNDEVINDENK